VKGRHMMKTIRVMTPSKEYDALVGEGLVDMAGPEAARVRKPGKAIIVSDSTVSGLYLPRLGTSLRGAGFDTCEFVFPPGESSKNVSTLTALLNHMARRRLTRSDTVFALGGGVTGDLAGLAASLYMRGIGLVQIPTTLLSAVDSSVGGKTAIDLDEGKNLAGTFYQPDLVLCDTRTLKTLPAAEYSNGCAEIIKYAMIRDGELIEELRSPDSGKIEGIIARCIAIKADIVRADERESGARKLLNFGHTFGHAIEKCSGYGVSHGSAVAAGMALITAACFMKGLCGRDCLDGLLAALRGCGLPASTVYGEEELFEAAMGDKKRGPDGITVVVARDIGRCELHEVSAAGFREFLRLGLRWTGGGGEI